MVTAFIKRVFKVLNAAGAILIICVKEIGALRGYFAPPIRPKNEFRFSTNSSY